MKFNILVAKLKENRAILAIFLLAIVLRCYYFDVNQAILADEGAYHYGALNLIEHRMITRDYYGEQYHGHEEMVSSPVIVPGYVFFIALLYKIFGAHIEIARSVNILLSVNAMLYIYKIMNVLDIRRRIKEIIIFLVAIYPGFIYNTQRLLTENLFAMLIIMAVYYYLLDWEESVFTKKSFFAGICLASAFFVKPVAIVVFFLIILAIFLNNNITLSIKFSKSAYYSLPLIIFTSLWCMRNYFVFGEIFFSKSGSSPIVWGLTPYFIGIGEGNFNSIKDNFNYVYSLDPNLFIRWKIFGHLQYMWGDLWDEFLRHPFILLKYLGLTHQFIIVPTFFILPKLIKYTNIKIIPIILMPIAFTFFYMIFHGLSRYVWPSVPFLFLALAIFINGNIKNKQIINSAKEQALRMLASYTTLIMASLIFFSVFIFPSFMASEMSKFSLAYRGKVDIDQVKQQKIIYNEDFYIGDPDIELQNFKIKNNLLYNGRNAGIINMKNLKTNSNDPIVTKVKLQGAGGFLFDQCIVYWKNNKEDEFNESLVYSFPTNSFQKKREIYIYGDVEELLILPISLKNGSYSFENINIKKYDVRNISEQNYNLVARNLLS